MTWRRTPSEGGTDRVPVGVGGAAGRPEGAVRPAEAGVALAPGPPAVLADDAVEERLPVARAVDGGHRLGLPGRLQRPAEPAAAAAGRVDTIQQPRRRRQEVAREEDGVEEQRRAEEREEAEIGRSSAACLLPSAITTSCRLHWTWTGRVSGCAS